MTATLSAKPTHRVWMISREDLEEYAVYCVARSCEHAKDMAAATHPDDEVSDAEEIE